VSAAYNPRPLWRWWLFCAALWVFSRARIDGRVCRVASNLMAWCVLPQWLGLSCERHEDCCAAWEFNPEERAMCRWPDESDAEVPF